MKDSPIRGPKDLQGKTVAVNTLNNIVHLMAMAWVDKYGGNSTKVKFVEIPFPQMEPALIAGKIDAISVQEPFAAAAARRPEIRVLSNPWGDVLPKFLIATWFASEKWIQKNKATAQAFVRGINRGIDAVHADPEGMLLSLMTPILSSLNRKIFKVLSSPGRNSAYLCDNARGMSTLQIGRAHV